MGRVARMVGALVALALSSCGGGGGTPAPIEGPVPAERAAGVVSGRLCRALRSCGCGELAGVSLSGCDVGFGFAWMAVEEDALEDGLTYDGDCLARRLNALATRGCATGVPSPGCMDENCQVFHGTLPEGADCDGGIGTSNCQQGLVCLGTCQLPCSGPSTRPLTEGEVCMEGEELRGICAPPLLCNPDGGLCTAPPGDGMACLLGQCADLHWCDPTGGTQTCRRQLAEGAPCTTPLACESVTCTGGTCGPLPTAGQMCAGRCAVDLVCARSTSGALTCAALPTRGEPCLADPLQRCQAGLACDDDVCVDPPESGEACLDFSAGLNRCGAGLVCGGRLCSVTPGAPGCDACTEPPDRCVVQVCMPEPPLVCSDQGGLLF